MIICGTIIDLQRKVSIDTKIKIIERENNMNIKEKVVTKNVIKLLYKYHLSS